MTYVEGGSPGTKAGWRRVAGTLRQLHRFTHGWPQRPGWRSSARLARRDRDEGTSTRTSPRKHPAPADRNDATAPGPRQPEPRTVAIAAALPSAVAFT